MPFNLYVNREKPITEADLHAVVKACPHAQRMPDGCYRLTNHDNVPTATVSLQNLDDAQRLKLSVSWTHYRFIYSWSNTFDIALHFAEFLKGRVIEESHYSEVTNANIDSLLDPDGVYVQRHLKLWRKFQSELNDEGFAYLEFPENGVIDKVNEYFVLRVSPPKLGTLEQLEKQLGWAIRLAPNSNSKGVIFDDKTGAPYTNILLRKDGFVQIRPFYFDKPFNELTKRAMDAADAIASLWGGKVQFFSRDLDLNLREELNEKRELLGVEFHQWIMENGSRLELIKR